MKKIILFALSIAALPIASTAQTYSAKFYTYFFGEIGEIDNLPQEAPAVELPNERAIAFAKGNPSFLEFIGKASSPIKIIRRDEQYSEDFHTATVISNEFEIKPAGGENSFLLTFKSAENVKRTNRDDRTDNIAYVTNDYDVEKTVKLDTPTLLYLQTEIKTVNDRVPFWGDIPLIGRLFQSKGESRSTRMLWVIITEVKE